MTILELREKRAKAWDAAKAFLDSHRTDKGTLSAEDDAAYSRMEQDITDLGKEIARMERREALDAELNKPVSQPITGKPAGDQQAEKKGRASDEYKRNFWNAMRLQGNPYEIRNALQEGTDSEGGYLVPDEYERTLVQALEEENVFRRLAKVIQTSSGDRKIPIVTSHGTAVWLDEEDALTESDEVFDQTSLSAYKLGTFLKVSDELLNDSVFDLPSYISTEFARRIGAKEEKQVNVRIIAAVNEDPEGCVERNKIREDIFYRLCVLRYDIPELYRRKGDIPLLMEYFRKHYNKKFHKQIMAYSSEVQDIFLAYNWPGNVRELKNVIESAFHNNHTAILTRNDIPNYILSRLAVDTMHAEDVRGLPLHEMLARYEVLLIEDAYRRNGGSLTKTAAELQVSKQNLAYKMKKYNIR